MTMGEKILAMRKARGWSQEELADRIGVTRQAVSRWESDSAKPDADKIIAVCDLFGVSADYLLRDSYTGEIRQTQAEHRPSNALAEKAQSMTLHQWYACGASLIGGLVLFVMRMIYTVQGTKYLYYDVFGISHQGYRGFLQSKELILLWWVALAAFLGGLYYLFIRPVILKDKEQNGGNRETD